MKDWTICHYMSLYHIYIYTHNTYIYIYVTDLKSVDFDRWISMILLSEHDFTTSIRVSCWSWSVFLRAVGTWRDRCKPSKHILQPCGKSLESANSSATAVDCELETCNECLLSSAFAKPLLNKYHLINHLTHPMFCIVQYIPSLKHYRSR